VVCEEWTRCSLFLGFFFFFGFGFGLVPPQDALLLVALFMCLSPRDLIEHRNLLLKSLYLELPHRRHSK